MRLWAIRWATKRGNSFIDYRTLSQTRRGAWGNHDADMTENHATDHWRAEVKRRKLAGDIKAVKVVLMEEQPKKEPGP